MKLEQDDKGDVVVAPAMLAQRLSIPEAVLRRLMQDGQVTSVVEVGEGEDAGRRRLSVRCGDTVWRAVVDAGLTVLEEETFDLRFRRWRSAG
ncbi:MAG: hypothetical protein F9K43_24450 [Bauldia sp.]|nr:MAG: hypothetical protein F9K43_24450 [Bauldia sp.]